jgi:hypothetical protein
LQHYYETASSNRAQLVGPHAEIPLAEQCTICRTHFDAEMEVCTWKADFID